MNKVKIGDTVYAVDGLDGRVSKYQKLTISELVFEDNELWIGVKELFGGRNGWYPHSFSTTPCGPRLRQEDYDVNIEEFRKMRVIKD